MFAVSIADSRKFLKVMIRVKLNQSIIRLAFYKHDSSTHNILRKHNVLQRLIQKIGTRNIIFARTRTTRELTY